MSKNKWRMPYSGEGYHTVATAFAYNERENGELMCTGKEEEGATLEIEFNKGLMNIKCNSDDRGIGRN